MQIVGYSTGVAAAEDGPDAPGLVLAADGRPERVDLSAGTELDYRLGERHCAGVIADGTHQSCDAPTAPYCEVHEDTWACARCTGQCDLPLESCREDHAVYLAAFAPDVCKVGVTRAWRLERRLREQGADRAAHLHTVSDGRIARRLEAEYASEFPDRVRTPTKVAALAAAVDADAWRAALDDRDPIATWELDYGLDLAERPIAETLAAGTVRGVQGRLLVLERAGGTYAVDLRDLVGHEVERAPDDRALQSNLSAFR